MSKKKNKYFEDYRNMVIFIVIILGVFIISFIGYTEYNNYVTNKTNSSYLVKKMKIKEYKIEDDLSELKNKSGDYFMYISYTGDEQVYKLEKELKSLIKQYNLADKFYYINIDSIKDNDNRLSEINSFLGLQEGTVSKLPTIIYVTKDNQIYKSNVITRLDDNMMEKGDFQQLLDINGF